LAINHVKI